MHSHDDRREISLRRFGEGSFPYTLLTGHVLDSELARLSNARSIGTTHCVSFQPNGIPDNWNQDRYVVQEILLENRSIWKLRAIFDGHLGFETVNHASEHLPIMLKDRLTGCRDFSTGSVSTILSETIKAYDESLLSDLLSVLPPEDQLSVLSEEEALPLINDGVEQQTKILRCMQGTTVVIALTSPGNEDLWVASLGDSYAVLGLEGQDHWESMVLSFCHRGGEINEKRRIMQEHPDEPQVIIRNRILGALAVSRAIGDHLYKLPRVYTDRVFLHTIPGWSYEERSFVKSFIQHNLTPPYISNIPDVNYVNLKAKRRPGDETSPRMCLLMFTDGLVDLYDEDLVDDIEFLFRRWMIVVTGQLDSSHQSKEVHRNGALSLLRDALGGEDEEIVSSMMTVEMEDKWMDDTTIVFEIL